MIVAELQRLQHEHGYLERSALKALAEKLNTPLYRLQEVASFFPHFRFDRPPTVDVRVCHDMACALRGSRACHEALSRKFGDNPAQVQVGYTSCLGRCDRPLATTINDELFVGRSTAALTGIVEQFLAGSPPPADTDAAAPSRHQRWKIDVYQGQPAYRAVRDYLQAPDPQALIDKLKTADLRGMGGAGVWAHQKWTDVWRARGRSKYIVCNGDESEPSTFKDRELLLRAPHLVLEGVILAGLVTNATRGYIYIRHEYPEQIAAVNAAIKQAEQLNACGRRIFGSARDFPVEVFVSPGGYICGEQSALIEAMEDRRAQPRNKPPQLETNGLYNEPTLVSNVETFAWAPAIAVRGGEWYRDLGRPGCKGARFFSICGDVKRPGVFEVPNGVTLRELIFDGAGGMLGDQKLRAVALSGPSGGFLPARVPVSVLARGWQEKFPADKVHAMLGDDPTTIDVLEIELDLQRSRDLGVMLGAGMAVYGDRADLVQQALAAVEFFRNESCGKCVPCRTGSNMITHYAGQIAAGQVTGDALARVTEQAQEITRTMELTSICGLGMVAGKPLTSLLQFFPEDAARVGQRQNAGQGAPRP